MDCQIHLTASQGPVRFGDNKEGVFGFRVAGTMKVDQSRNEDKSRPEGGTLFNSNGDRNADTWEFPFWDPRDIDWAAWHKKWGHLEAVDPLGRKRYLANLMALDDSVTRILDKLDETKQRRNTIIVFLSELNGKRDERRRSADVLSEEFEAAFERQRSGFFVIRCALVTIEAMIRIVNVNIHVRVLCTDCVDRVHRDSGVLTAEMHHHRTFRR